MLAPGLAPPGDEEGKWACFRGLVNRRPPGLLPEGFLELQDALLQAEREVRGVTEAGELPLMRGRLALWQGDITTLRADAIVNAANSALLGCFWPSHRCIDNAIHTYAGVQLREACARLMAAQGHPEPTGRARITPGFNLPAAHVIHTVGPIVERGLTERHRWELAGCYRASLELAEERGLASLVFCCISTGEFRFPNREAARIAIDTVDAHLSRGSGLARVIFNVFTEGDLAIYRELLG